MNNGESCDNGRKLSRNFGAAIRYYREKQGYSLHDVYMKTGISTSYLQRLEVGKRRSPTLPIITKIAEALEVSIEDLIDLKILDKDETLPTIAQLLLQNEVEVNGEIINPEAKLILISIVESIIDFVWADKEKNQEIFELLELVEDFKDSL